MAHPKNKIKPGPGQESVWDYPRPPILEPDSRHVRILFNGEILADSSRTKRMLETSHPPVFYIPLADIKKEALIKSERHSFCEFKGRASYCHVRIGSEYAKNATWYYPEPSVNYPELKDHFAFYPSLMEACYVGDERIEPQEGDFYGGWITKEVVGPFKGAPGTWGW